MFTCKETESFGFNNFNQKKSSLSPLILIFLFSFLIFNLKLFADSEPNNTCNSANSFTLNSFINGSLRKDNPNKDEYDYYSFTPTSSGTITIDTENFSGDMDAYLYNSSCSSQLEQDTSYSSNISMTYDVSAGTTYKLLLYAYSGNSDYRLNINLDLSFSGSNFDDFSILYSENFRGDIRMIGNTIVGEKNNKSTTCPGDNTNNAAQGLQTKYWDIDGLSSTFNSSSSDLSIPTGAIIKKAYLYWQGRAKSNEYTNAKSIKFKAPGASDYTSLSASDHNVHWNSYNSYYPYQASVDVTSLINGSGTYTIADLTTYTGNYIDGLGAYGAWSLVVVYAEDDEPLQNITIYDGYKTIASQKSQNFTLSGFLTPTNGDVNSKFLIFTGEGDVDLKKDYVKMGGTRLTRFNDNNNNSNNYNTFNASITKDDAYVTTRNPSCQNNLGIDIHTYDVGTSGLGIIGNNQTSTILEIGTGQDAYYLSVFAFATELYEPRVCYYIKSIQDDDNTTIFENRSFVEDIEVGKNYHFDLWISNMKKESTDTALEDAKLVQVYVKMKNGFNYTEDSTWIKNIGTNYANNDGYYNVLDKNTNSNHDIGDFSSDNNTSYWRVGNGATDTQGGSLIVASSFNDDTKKAFIKIEGSFDIEDGIEDFDLSNYYEFKASFQTDSITIGADEAQTIEECVDLDTAGNIRPIGAFNVVNENFNRSDMKNEPTDESNALYTQVVNRPFNVKILSLSSEGSSTTQLKKTSKKVGLSIVDGTQECESADLIQDLGNITFNSQEIFEKTDITINKASRNAMFKIVDEDESSCSLDSFAIRPDKFNLTISGTTPYVAGAEHDIAFTALDYDDENVVTTYTATHNTNFKVDTNETLAGCATGTFSPSLTSGWNFTSGTKYFNNITYSEVGQVNIKISEITDSEYAVVDKLDTSDTDRLISEFSTTLTFTPDHFSVTPTMTQGGNNFTYLSSDLNMSVILDIDITAEGENNNTTENYNTNCYAKTTDYDLSYSYTPDPSSAISKVLYRETNTSTDGNVSLGDNINLNNVPKTIFSTTNKGTGSIQVLMNFDRNNTKVVNPFKLTVEDINVTDSDSVSGTENLDQNATFYYGRVHAPDHRFEAEDGTANIYYEVYCDGCNKASYNINGNESIDSINWFTNTLHANNDGNVSTYAPLGSVDVDAISIITNGKNTIDLTAPSTPYKDKITMTSDSWLEFSPTDFIVEFYGEGNWAGQGIQGKTVDINISKRQNKRLDW